VNVGYVRFVIGGLALRQFKAATDVMVAGSGGGQSGASMADTMNFL
jgi:hypothetical protein